MIERWNIAAGELRQRVTIEAKTVAGSADAYGHPQRTWTSSIANVSAKIETLSGRKLELARQLVATASHVITIRYRALDVNTKRINYDGRIFAIGHQEDVAERHVKLILTCTEEMAAS